MFGLGVWEIALILAVALVVLGPRKLPQVAKQVGRSLREFRRAAADLQVTLEQEADAEERRERQARLAAAAKREPPPALPTAGIDSTHAIEDDAHDYDHDAHHPPIEDGDNAEPSDAGAPQDKRAAEPSLSGPVEQDPKTHE